MSASDDAQYREYIRVRLTDRVLFDSGADYVSPEGIDVLTRLGAILKDERDIEITIQGHTDNRPIRERLRPKFPDNMALSQARAANASQILKNSGVQQDALVLKWFGETHPMTSNDSEDNRRKNRRVEIMITPKEGR
jgi:chemotaxis protein MotB